MVKLQFVTITNPLSSCLGYNSHTVRKNSKYIFISTGTIEMICSMSDQRSVSNKILLYENKYGSEIYCSVKPSGIH